MSKASATSTISLSDLFAAPTFRQQGHAMIDFLADYLNQIQEKPDSIPVLPARFPSVDWHQQQQMNWPKLALEGLASKQSTHTLPSMIAPLLAQSNHLHHPGYIGHQVSVPLPLAVIIHTLTSLLNNGSAVFEMGPVNTILEHRVIEWMNHWVCLDTEYVAEHRGGYLTSGGSVGNLSALQIARLHYEQQHEITLNNSEKALAPCILVSEQAHYCIQRAARMMGLGNAGVIAIETDSHFRMSLPHLKKTIQDCQHQSRPVLAVVGSACTTATGSYDPLEATAEICRENRLWFHVDGAHGASALISQRYRHLLKGIEHADSIVWDAHKMLQMPALVTGVLFKDKHLAYLNDPTSAAYLLEGKEAAEHTPEYAFDLAHQTLECTKTMMATPLYTCLQHYGVKPFQDHIENTYSRCQDFAEWLQQQPDFELPVLPQSNIVCFRYIPDFAFSNDQINAFQGWLREEIIASGQYYLVKTTLNGKVYLRLTLMNPLTTSADLIQMIDTLREIARSDRPLTQGQNEVPQ
ncbi:MAG: pyridoxal-dependent decarboxylase [Cyanobacteria bacterium]|nr:pyridoxal-dependent decarboxylase [Cyanobacteriota bacterium]